MIQMIQCFWMDNKPIFGPTNDDPANNKPPKLLLLLLAAFDFKLLSDKFGEGLFKNISGRRKKTLSTVLGWAPFYARRPSF